MSEEVLGNALKEITVCSAPCSGFLVNSSYLVGTEGKRGGPHQGEPSTLLPSTLSTSGNWGHGV